MGHMSKASVFLAVFKRIFIQLLKIEKLGEGHVEGEGNTVESFHSRIFGLPPAMVVVRPLYAAHVVQLVYLYSSACKAPLCARHIFRNIPFYTSRFVLKNGFAERHFSRFIPVGDTDRVPI